MKNYLLKTHLISFFFMVHHVRNKETEVEAKDDEENFVTFMLISS